MNNNVYALFNYNNTLVAGGDFTTAGGIAAEFVATWNGTSWVSLHSNMSEGTFVEGS